MRGVGRYIYPSLGGDFGLGSRLGGYQLGKGTSMARAYGCSDLSGRSLKVTIVRLYRGAAAFGETWWVSTNLVMVKRCYEVSISMKDFIRTIRGCRVEASVAVDITSIRSDQEVNAIWNRDENSNLQVNTRTNLRTKV